MKLIVGLGNPGEKYKNNRHNVGYMFIEHLEKIGLPDGVVAKKTNTFMNDSGEAVKKLVNFYKVSPEDLYVVHDDLDIPLGQHKIQLGVGPKVHKGVASVEQFLIESEFWRIRIGVDNRDSQNRLPGEQYVLQDFTGEEKEIVKNTIKQIFADLATHF